MPIRSRCMLLSNVREPLHLVEWLGFTCEQCSYCLLRACALHGLTRSMAATRNMSSRTPGIVSSCPITSMTYMQRHCCALGSLAIALCGSQAMHSDWACMDLEPAVEFLQIARQAPVETHVHQFALHEANDALDRLRHGHLSGAAVLTP
jgi:hypothetical protein